MSGSNQPAVQQVSDKLRFWLRRLEPGARLPSQMELADHYGVSRDTVQKALKDLADADLIVSQQGSGSRVAGEKGEPVEAYDGQLQPALDALKPYVEEALKSPEVTVDFYGLTSETLTTVLKPLLNLLEGTDAPRPESLVIRLLLPSLKEPGAVPRSTERPDDGRPRERLHSMSERFVTDLREAMVEAKVQGWIPETELQVQYLDEVPVAKLYVINGNRALLGFYEVVDAVVQVPGEGSVDLESLRIRDLRGLSALLMPQPPVYVENFKSWFDGYWAEVASREGGRP